MTSREAESIEELIARRQARAVDEHALRTLFGDARSIHNFLPRPLPRELLERVVALAELGPTSANSLPVRYVFVDTPAGKKRLEPSLGESNREKTMAAPVTAIVAADLRFYERMAETNPSRPEAAKRFEGSENAGGALEFARDNALLQMGYFILAARALGLDSGAMGGFRRDLVDAEFFPDGRWIALYLINLGYGDGTDSKPRQPRLRAADIVRFV